MTLEEIKADVKHCLELEDANDPCYHCRQKLWLIQQLELMMNPPQVITVSVSPAEEAEFLKKINNLTSNAWKMAILPAMGDPMNLYATSELTQDQIDAKKNLTPESDTGTTPP